MSALELFPGAAPKAPVTRAVRLKEPDLLSIVARQKLGTTEAWSIYRWKLVGNTDDRIVTGSPCRPGTDREVEWFGASSNCVVTKAEVDAALIAWESETGRCARCGGNATMWHGWSRDQGVRYVPCTRCGATGKAVKQ